MEIAYTISGYRRVVQIENWYFVETMKISGKWHRIYGQNDCEGAIKFMEIYEAEAF